MAKASLEIITALRSTAIKLAVAPDYQWGHMGACNCGFLAQQVTLLSKSEIHSRAMEGHGDWREQLNDYCPTSGLNMDNLISELVNFGFDVDDLTHLERLSDPAVLQCLPASARTLQHNNKEHVILYLHTMASRLENILLKDIKLPRVLAEEVYLS